MTRDQLLAISALLPEPILLIGAQGMVLGATPKAARLLRMSPGAIEGVCLADLAAVPAAVEVYLRRCAEARPGGEPVADEIALRGGQRMAEVFQLRATRVSDGGDATLLVHMAALDGEPAPLSERGKRGPRDEDGAYARATEAGRNAFATVVSQARRNAESTRVGADALLAERAARHAAERAAARSMRLHGLVKAFACSRRVPEVAEAAVAGMRAALGAGASFLYMPSAGGATLDLVASSGYPDTRLAQIQSFPASADALVPLAARSGFPTWRDDDDIGLGLDLRVAGALPFRAGLGRNGVIVAAFRSKQPISDDERALAITIVGACEGAIEQASNHARAERAADRAHRLLEVTTAFAEAQTSADVAGVVLAQSCAAVGAPRGVIALIAEDGVSAEVVSAAGWPEAVLARRRRFPLVAPTPLAHATRSGVTRVFASGAAVRARYPMLEPGGLEGSEALAAVALVVGERPIGVMALSFDGPWPGATEDTPFLETLARVSAQAIERARLFEAEASARRAAEAANRAKDEFLSMLSHELRTPLTAVLGWANILRTKQLDPAARTRALDTIERNARAQAQLVEDILDVSRVVAGKLRLDVSLVDPAPSIAAALDAVRPAAEVKGVQLDAAIDRGTGPVAGDPVRVQQIAWNLLSNAIKFSAPGGRITVRLERCGAWSRLTVTDTGQGIEPAFLPHVFERFRQADSSSTRAHGGLGLGLAIVKHLVELHGGAVTAASEGAGRGATFTVTLPRASRAGSSAVSHPHAARGHGPPRLDGVRVLLVEDEPDARDLIATILKNEGAEVSEAGSGDEAFDALSLRGADVFVSDIGLPGEDGYALMQRIREARAAADSPLPALALTAYAGAQDERMARIAGFQKHLPKPVAPDRLIEAVAELAGRRAITRPVLAAG